MTSLKIISSLVILSAALIYIGLERLFPYQRGQKTFRKGFFLDLFWYTLVQSYVLGLIIAAIIEWIDGSSGISRLRIISDWPVAAQVALFVVTHDFYIYWMHRLQHHWPLLWRTHEAHHATDEVDWISGSRSHPIEILINQTIEFLPIVLLGAAPEVAIYKGMISAVWGMFIHSNIRVSMGPLRYFLNGPELHRWHHSRSDRRAWDRNFATKLAIWDWAFGTTFLPPGEKVREYGLEDRHFPTSYWGQIVYAFRKSRP
ncbi:MAG: sterol desaturase family protein, partial [Betaproteobacteria bacterium]|nr:sterol desaturase family protein [Betaproteobacteria bacterium]